MAHLDTAYKLGALRAQTDFETEINKMAAAPLPPLARQAGGPPQIKPGTEIGAQPGRAPARQAPAKAAPPAHPGLDAALQGVKL